MPLRKFKRSARNINILLTFRIKDMRDREVLLKQTPSLKRNIDMIDMISFELTM